MIIQDQCARTLALYYLLKVVVIEQYINKPTIYICLCMLELLKHPNQLELETDFMPNEHRPMAAGVCFDRLRF